MKIVICGAGIAGLALANRLDELGWDVTVLEKAPGPRPQGYMIDFFGAGYDAIEAMGALPRLHELGYQVDELRYTDHAGRPRAGLKLAQFAEALDGRLVSIMRPDLEELLRERLSGDVDLRYSTSPAEVTDTGDGVHVTLVDGDTIEADLLVGADGIHSTVRRMVFGSEHRYVRSLGFHTAAFVFDDPVIHDEVRGRFCVTDSIDRQMGFYALRDGRVASFAVQRRSDALPEDPQAEIRKAYRSLGWLMPRAVENCPPASEVYYDDVAQVVMQRWSSGRVVLLGDSCQAVSLLAGQGASLGVAGAYVLAAELADADTVEGALERYERAWRPVVEEKQKVGRNMVTWFLPDSRRRLWMRRAALGLAERFGLDRFLVTGLGGKSTGLIREMHARRARSGGTRAGDARAVTGEPDG
ncbi:FAD-dependent monooxygenase [Parasphingorhabdus pacifica]